MTDPMYDYKNMIKQSELDAANIAAAKWERDYKALEKVTEDEIDKLAVRLDTAYKLCEKMKEALEAIQIQVSLETACRIATVALGDVMTSND